jgi:adenylylsulfate kinase-like enzyme
MPSRITQAQRMGSLSGMLNSQGFTTVADFVCPTTETRKAFGDCFTIWVDRIKEGRFSDTNDLFQKPIEYNLRIPFGISIKDSVDLIVSYL